MAVLISILLNELRFMKFRKGNADHRVSAPFYVMGCDCLCIHPDPFSR